MKWIYSPVFYSRLQKNAQCFELAGSSVADIAVNSSLAGTAVDYPKGMPELLSASERAIERLKGLDLIRLSLRRLSS